MELSRGQIILRRLLANSPGVIIVLHGTINVAYAVLLEVSLRFLDLGIAAPQPSWISMLSQAQSRTILQQRPWMWLPPGQLVLLTVLSINFIGEGISDIFDTERH